MYSITIQTIFWHQNIFTFIEQKRQCTTTLSGTLTSHSPAQYSETNKKYDIKTLILPCIFGQLHILLHQKSCSKQAGKTSTVFIYLEQI